MTKCFREKEQWLRPCWGYAICHSVKLSWAGAGDNAEQHTDPGMGTHRARGSVTLEEECSAGPFVERLLQGGL